MLCNNCKQEFDDRLNVPRLLILCGHSLCENCCYRIHANNRVDCPECHSSTFIDSISLLPKNLALITQSRSRQHEFCGKHSKRYEAFCEKQNQLICIECILQDGHKNHQMDSIHNCFEKHQNKWVKKIEKLERYSEKIQEILVQNRKNHQQYREGYNTARDTVTKFYKEIREAIDREEEGLFSKLRENYALADNTYEERIRLASNSIGDITQKIDSFKACQDFGQIQFLESYNSRQATYASISQQAQEPYKGQLINFSKKSTLEGISKVLNSLNFDKSQKKAVSTVVSNASTLSNQTRKQNEPVSIKAVRKAVPSTAPSIQPFSLNKKKTSVKRDTVSAVTVHGVTATKFTDEKEKKEIQLNNLAKELRSDLSSVDPKESLCHSFMSNMTVFLSERKSIYLVGGFNEQANNIIKLNLFNFQWEDVCSLNFNRSKFGSAAVGKQIYVFGGKRGKDRVNDSQIYNANTKKWTRLTPMAKSRSGFAVIAIEDLLYFIGGNDGDSILNTVETLNVVTGEWRRKESMNEARDQLAVVVSRNKIYAIGGFGGADSQPLKSVQVYDPKTQKWKMIPPMNEARRALAAAVLADGVYAIGGFDGSLYMSSVERFDEGEKEWSYVAQMKQSRCTHSAVSLFESQQIYVFGGFDYVPLDSVERYNVISNEWETVCRMPNARFMHSSLLIKEE